MSVPVKLHNPCPSRAIGQGQRASYHQAPISHRTHATGLIRSRAPKIPFPNHTALLVGSDKPTLCIAIDGRGTHQGKSVIHQLHIVQEVPILPAIPLLPKYLAGAPQSDQKAIVPLIAFIGTTGHNVAARRKFPDRPSLFNGRATDRNRPLPLTQVGQFQHIYVTRTGTKAARGAHDNETMVACLPDAASLINPKAAISALPCGLCAGVVYKNHKQGYRQEPVHT